MQPTQLTPQPPLLPPDFCPYKGLVPYAEADADFFFGRERDRQLIVANLHASRLTIAYGASGVGKSSVLRAGVAHHLHREAGRAVVVFDGWKEDPVGALKRAAAAEIERILQREVADPDDAPLDDFLNTCGAGLRRPLVVILDQFEEYFLYRPQYRSPHSFATEFARAINDPECPATFLVSLREDALAKLDHFEDRIPILFDNYLRIEHLNRAAATDAIMRPVEVYNRALPEAQHMHVEPGLAGTVIEGVRAGAVILGGAGRGQLSPRAAPQGGTPREAEDVRVEAPYLQLVMTRLWDEERNLGSHTLRVATLTALGGVEKIIRTHLDRAMAHLRPDLRELAAPMFLYLVTPSGAKIAHRVRDLAWYIQAPERPVAAVVDRLSQRDLSILRSIAPVGGVADSEEGEDPAAATRYEIFHDALAPAVLDWSTRYANRIALPRRQLAVTLAVVFVLAIVQLFPAVPPIILVVARAATLAVLNTIPLLQIYRWFSRSIGFAASLSPATYGGPSVGLLLGLELSVLWYVSTGWPRGLDASNALGAITPTQFTLYLLTVMLTLLCGFLTFLAMRSGGQITFLVFKRFEAGFYGVYFAVCAFVVVLIVLAAVGVVPPWIKF